ncbi:MAG TPA: hypothetical protein VFV66_02345 [Nonomuraea sp.]|nr:hypothetical protein [Nonomuraea sp.]
MPHTRFPRRLRKLAPKSNGIVHKDGLALKFVLLLIDRAVADAQCGACHLDAITLRFPEVDFLIRLAPYTTGRQLHVAFEASFRVPGDRRPRKVRWELLLSGKLGTARQRAAILKEITKARRNPAQLTRNGYTVRRPSQIRTTWALISSRLTTPATRPATDRGAAAAPASTRVTLRAGQ